MVEGMTLKDGTVGRSYHVKALALPRQQEIRLSALGLTLGTSITVLNKKAHGAVIFNVRGTRLAVGQQIAGSIQIEDERALKAVEGHGLA